MRFLRARDEGRLAQVIITRRVPILLSMECSGTTEWGVKLMSNPFFNGNPMLDDVARALGVKSNDVSAYVLHKQTTFLAWVSDQRLRRSAELIAATCPPSAVHSSDSLPSPPANTAARTAGG